MHLYPYSFDSFFNKKSPGFRTSTSDRVQMAANIWEDVRSAVLVQQLREASPSWVEWQEESKPTRDQHPEISEIMDMIGLEDVKAQILRLKARVETCILQRIDLKEERLGLVLLGNPGTGKTTIARLYSKALTSLAALPGPGFVETTGSRLANGGIKEVQDDIAKIIAVAGGGYFIDEAYQLTNGNNFGGRAVLDYLLPEIENLVGTVVFTFAGYRREMEKFLEHNPGLAGRLPYLISFKDYTNPELLSILQRNIARTFRINGMMIEGGPDGLYMRIAINRLGHGRGQHGFGNARAVEVLASKIRERQADRFKQERRSRKTDGAAGMTQEDLIGPDPSIAILDSAAWIELQAMTGLEAVKQTVQNMIADIGKNYRRELREEPPFVVSLNRVFIGPPGTGKTTVAKLYGQILADVGLLSNGEVVVNNPADFIGSAIGQSEANTKAILENTMGKVLVIDEAYMLKPSTANGESSGIDAYKRAVIDILVAEVQSVPGEDRCVLLLGYEDEMLELFQNTNQGLSRRFRIDDPFRFEDFDNAQLEEILMSKLDTQKLKATGAAVDVAIRVLDRARNKLNFGNGGEVENLLAKAKDNYRARQRKLPAERQTDAVEFEPEDFDLAYDRSSKQAKIALDELFKDVVGCDEMIAKLQSFYDVGINAKVSGLDPLKSIPMTFVFKGPPGTGKTTTARKIGQIYYDLGFLSEAEVIEASVSDLEGQFVGQTAPKVRKLLERSLGKVLLIDEAYRLSYSPFGREAISQLVESMTQKKFQGKLIIILSGYEDAMNTLFQLNEGLSGRFTEDFMFAPLTPEHCLSLLESKLISSKMVIPSLQDTEVRDRIITLLGEISRLPGWANARDVANLGTSIVRTVLETNSVKSDQPLEVSQDIVTSCLKKMISKMQARDVGPRPLSSSPVSSTLPTPLSSPVSSPPPSPPLSPPSPLSYEDTPATPRPRLLSIPRRRWSPFNFWNRQTTSQEQPRSRTRSSSPIRFPSEKNATKWSATFTIEGQGDHSWVNSILRGALASLSMNDVEEESETPRSTVPYPKRYEHQPPVKPTSAALRDRMSHAREFSMPMATAEQQASNWQTTSVGNEAAKAKSRPRETTNEGSGLRKPSTTLDPLKSDSDSQRDAGVSDAIWNQLQSDKRKRKEEDDAEKLKLKKAKAAAKEAEQQRLLAEEEARKLAAIKARDEAHRLQLLLQREEAERKAAEARMAEQEAKRQKDLQRKQYEERKRKEQEVQAQLRRMGVCPMGYAWIRQCHGGYRCAGGSHYIGNHQL